MMRRLIYIAVLTLTLSACAEKPVKNPEMTLTPSKKQLTGYAPVNGISMYYEIHGGDGGVPLVLLPGGGSTIDVSYGRMIPILSDSRQVIAVEEQGHGRTTDRKGPETFEQTADDVYELLKSLKIERADVMGFSNGASNALQLAIRHPEVVRKLIFVSSFTKRSGAAPGFWNYMKTANFAGMPQPLKDAYLKVNPDPAKLRAMHDKDLARMHAFKDVSDGAVRSVKAPTLLLAGDHDVVRIEHIVELSKLIKGSRVSILPGGHGEFLGELVMTPKPSRMPNATAELVGSFLDQ